MRRFLSFRASAALLLAAARAPACPCQGSSGPGGAVTTSMDRFGGSVTETSRFVSGEWLANGKYEPLAPGDQQLSLDTTVALGYRPIPAIELGAESAFGHQSVSSASSPATSSTHTGFGDLILRARWEALDEPMPWEKTALPWPSVAFVASVRAPTASLGRGTESVFSGTTGSVGSAASSEGLGAWETSMAVALVRSIGPKFQLNLAGEAAYRFADSALGIQRHLAPRFLGQVGARYSPSTATGFGVMTDLGAEGDVTYQGAVDPATNMRLWAIGAYAFYRAEPTALRCGVMVRYEPALDDVSRNASRATSFAVSLGYAL